MTTNMFRLAWATLVGVLLNVAEASAIFLDAFPGNDAILGRDHVTLSTQVDIGIIWAVDIHLRMEGSTEIFRVRLGDEDKVGDLYYRNFAAVFPGTWSWRVHVVRPWFLRDVTSEWWTFQVVDPDIEAPVDTFPVTVTIVEDDNPQQTSWVVRESLSNNVVLQGNRYSGTAWLPSGAYTLEVRDSAGDGLCCTAGRGSFSLVVAGAKVYGPTTSAWGDFGASTGELPFSIFSDGFGMIGFGPAPSTTPSMFPSQSGQPTDVPSEFPSSVPTPISSVAAELVAAEIAATPSASPSVEPSREMTSNVPSSLPTPFRLQTPGPPMDESDESGDSFRVQILVLPDRFPEEISWVLKDGTTGAEIQSGGSESADVVVGPGYYTFSMNDSFGDGLCCEWGDGFFQLSVDDEEVFYGAEIGFSTGPLAFLIGPGGAVDVIDAPPTQDPPLTSQTISMGLQPDCFNNDLGKFNICLFLEGPKDRDNSNWMRQFANAAARWESIITTDDGGPYLSSEFYTQYGEARSYPPMLDDAHVSGTSIHIDGIDGILGLASPTIAAIKADGMTRVSSGFIELDIADVEWLLDVGLYESVILHELGHVLGIGTLWEENFLYNAWRNRYTGEEATRQYFSYGLPGDSIPIETAGGAETAGGHWAEVCLLHELMTGFVDHGMRLSRISIGALKDLGYNVDMSAADDFSVDGTGCVRRLGGQSSHHRELSEEGRKRAEEYGQEVLAKNNDKMKASKNLLQEGMRSRPWDFVEVLYIETGDVYAVPVKRSTPGLR